MSNLLELMADCTRKLAILREQERSQWLQRFSFEKKKLTSTKIAIIEFVYENESKGEQKTPYTEIVEKIYENKSSVLQATIAEIVKKKYENKSPTSQDTKAEVLKEIDKAKHEFLRFIKSTVTQTIAQLENEKCLSKDIQQVRKPTVALTDKGIDIGYGLHNIDRFLILKLLVSEDNRSESFKKIFKDSLKRAITQISDCSKQNEAVEALANADTARLYDYLIGGQFFFPIEEQAAKEMKKVVPFISDCAKANRAFMRRAIEYLAKKGIKQFIDIGAGLLSYGNIHEIVSKHFDDYKVLYLDSDPYVANVSRYILSGEKNSRFLQISLEQTNTIWDEAKKFGIKPSKPVAIFAVAVIHFIEDFDVAKDAIEELYQKISSGSYFVISHAHIPKNSSEQNVPDYSSENGDKVINLYSKIVRPVFKRSKSEIKEIFDKNEIKLVPFKKDQSESDLVFAPQWRPDIPDKYLFGSEPPLQKTPEQSFILVGVGKKVRKGK